MIARNAPIPRPRLSKLAADHRKWNTPANCSVSSTGSNLLSVENPEYMTLDMFKQLDIRPYSNSSYTGHSPGHLQNEKTVIMAEHAALVLMDNSRSARSSWMDAHPEPTNPRADSEMVCYSGWTSVTLNRKDCKRLWCKLKNRTFTFHPSDVEDTEVVLGPISLEKLVYIGKNAQNSASFSLIIDTILGHFPSPLFLQLQVVDSNLRDCWLMLLSKCMVPKHKTLVYSLEGDVDQAGPIFVRQGATSCWCRGWAYTKEKRLLYVTQNSDDVFEMDIRKLKSIKENVNANDWCPLIEHSLYGPMLLTQDGSSLYMQASLDFATKTWFKLLQNQLLLSSNRLEDQRLTIDDVPVIVTKCINFIATHGILQEGIYRKSGSMIQVRQLMDEFLRDPTDVHIVRDNDDSVNTVTEVLRRFLRRLDDPLLTKKLRQHLFQISSLPEADFDTKMNEYQQAMNDLPLINYQTTRKLLDHLKDVTEKSSRNKATIPNIAKVFGPTLLNVDQDDDDIDTVGFSQTQPQVQVVHDLISNFATIFHVTEREITAKSQIDKAAWINDAVHQTGRAPKARADGMLVPIHVLERDNQAFNVQSDMTTDQVVRFGVEHRHLSLNEGPYALFEMVRNGQLERKVHRNEKVGSMVVGRWLEWKNETSDCFLILKKDQLARMLETMEPYPFASEVKIAEIASKSFKKASMQYKNGQLCYYKDSKCQKIAGEWPMEKVLWFFGHETKRCPPTDNTLTFLVEQQPKMTPEKGKFLGFCVAFKFPTDKIRWMAAVSDIGGPFFDSNFTPLVDYF